MKSRYFIQALVAVLSVIALLGFPVNAQAATLSNPTATSTASIGTTGTNSAAIVVSATLATVGNAETMFVYLPAGWSFASGADGSCSSRATNDLSGSMCQAFNWSPKSTVIVASPSGNFSSALTISVTFPANSLNVAPARDFFVKFRDDSTSTDIDTGTAVLAGGVSNQTVTFSANGGTGAMADQLGSSASALSTNSFTRSGYVFSGWSTSATGSVEYADAASFSFSSSTTLYALWTPTLANTGTELTDSLIWGIGLTLFGALVLLSSRRRLLR
ncbi:InlB B-repeat-containing protein [uncultured Aurantimicrobium sp.]|uniref:InlB B-repeat-containing protein n=1 Tax=uncultured Aurantimicrobium sp. TaxID=1705357 RepID=UPI002633DA94|nr:InlB B-repeat-containing protein [uncultured Aurantimicrobium sp.]